MHACMYDSTSFPNMLRCPFDVRHRFLSYNSAHMGSTMQVEGATRSSLLLNWRLLGWLDLQPGLLSNLVFAGAHRYQPCLHARLPLFWGPHLCIWRWTLSSGDQPAVQMLKSGWWMANAIYHMNLATVWSGHQNGWYRNIYMVTRLTNT